MSTWIWSRNLTLLRCTWSMDIHDIFLPDLEHQWYVFPISNFKICNILPFHCVCVCCVTILKSSCPFSSKQDQHRLLFHTQYSSQDFSELSVVLASSWSTLSQQLQPFLFSALCLCSDIHSNGEISLFLNHITHAQFQKNKDAQQCGYSTVSWGRSEIATT